MRGLQVVGMAVMLWGCTDTTRPSTGAELDQLRPMHTTLIPTCEEGCLLQLSVQAFQLPANAADSAGLPSVVGTTIVRGDSGTLTLSVTMDVEAIAALDDTVTLGILLGQDTTIVSLEDLRDTVQLPVVLTADTMAIRVLLVRRALTEPLTGSITFKQTLSSSLTIERTTWQPPTRLMARMGEGQFCDMYATPSMCGMYTSYLFDVPVYPSYVFGTASNGFTSDLGTGSSSSIRIMFNAPVENVTVWIHDATWSGNQARAYAYGVPVDMAGFVGSSMPGEYIVQSHTFTGPITSLELAPADNDFVVWEVRYQTIYTEDPPAPSLHVSCDSTTVRRGNSVTCTATSSPAGTPITIYGWEFTPTTGTGATASIDESTSAAQWSGVMVVGGTITAVGVLDTLTLTSNAVSVTVTNRTWGTIASNITSEAFTLYPNSVPKSKESEWGQSVPNFGTDDGDQVTSGPNKGLRYFATQPALFVAINYRSALQSTSVWYAMQTGTGGKCGPTQVEMFKPGLRRHEGATGASNSHVGIWLNMLSSTYTFKGLFEKVVGSSAFDFQLRRDSLWMKLDTAAIPQVNALHTADIPYLLTQQETLGSCVFAF